MGFRTVLVWEKRISSPSWIGVPHLLQKRESSEISTWHLGHFIGHPPLCFIDKRISMHPGIVNECFVSALLKASACALGMGHGGL